MVLFENTAGLAETQKHRQYFRKLLNQCTENDYSIRYKVVSFDGYGVAQKRKRLIVIASCPGSVLPPFPSPTHGPGTGRPYVTIAEALAPLTTAPTGTYSHHNPDELEAKAKAQGRLWAPYSSDQPLASCITCDSSEQAHPNGKRRFTGRDLAFLQGFEDDYKFDPKQSQTKVIEMVGNACPPVG